MGRERRPLKRPANKRNAKLIVIATEGRKTERIYFEKLAETYDSTAVHVKVIEKLDNNSSPVEVLRQLDDFAAEYKLDKEDELWMVIDRDFKSWNEKMLKSVAQTCAQKKGYYLGLSNPAFEIWLLLHITDLEGFSEEELMLLFMNRKINRNKSYCKKKLSDLLGGFNEAKYEATVLVDQVQKAISRAKSLDIKPKSRWPNYLGTRVYKLAANIITKK